MSDIATQYRIITTGAGWIENAVRGRLRFDGADRVAFLQALLTNDLEQAQPGSSVYAAYLTPQGRMITDLHLHVRSDCVIADVPAPLASKLAATFDLLVFSEDVQVSDQTSELRQFSVIGARAGEIAKALDLAPPGFAVKTDDADEGSWDVIVPADAASATIAALESAGAVAIGPELVEALRIDAGRPLFGVDMTTETIPLEAGILDRAISQSKGCYVGQEVIIRILHRGSGRVAKRLMQIACDSADAPVPIAGAAISIDGKEVGTITSAAWSPRAQKPVALGYIARDTAAPGARVQIAPGIDASISGVVGAPNGGPGL